MPVISVSNDPAAKTVTLTAELDAPVERAWQLYADPHQLEQWWNPPGYPLTTPITTCPSAGWCALT